MGKAKKKSYKNPLLTPAYSLKRVKELVYHDQFELRGEALWTVRRDFAWDARDIKKFLLSLRGVHFYKKARAKPVWQVEWFDFYKGELYGQTVYTHFFVEGDRLVVVNSCKRDESVE